MEQKTKVHRWTSRTEYYDIETGEQISKKLKIRDYDTLKINKRIKIENYHGYITYEHECERKRQTKLW